MDNKEDLLDLLHEKLAGVIDKENDAFIESLLLENEEVRQLWQQVQQNAISQDYLEGIRPLKWREIHRRTIAKSQRRLILRNSAMAMGVVCAIGWLAWIYWSMHQEIPGRQLTAIDEIPVQWKTLIVPSDRRYTVVLSDSSVVRLNPGAQLKYPMSFTGKLREVYLVNGQALFEVSSSSIKHNDLPPFIVHTAKATLTVLGTIFKVSYTNGRFSTTLISGKIKLTNGYQSLALLPGQQAVLDNATGKLVVKKPTPKKNTWDNPVLPLQLSGFTLGDIGKWSKKLYHIEVLVADHSKDRFSDQSILIDGEQSLEDFLQTVHLLDSNFHYHFQGDTLYLQ
jgi:Fe2+-dicitrate sensor, membrane component